MVADVVAMALGLVVDDNVWIRLLDLLSVLGNMDLLSVVSTTVLEALPVVRPATEIAASLWTTTLAKPFGLAPLIILGRLHVDLLVQDEVAFLLVLHDDFLLKHLSLILVLKCDQDKAESTATLGFLVAHYDGVIDPPKHAEVLVKIVFVGVEGQTTDKELDLVFLRRLVEGRGGITLVSAMAHAEASKATDAAHVGHAWQTQNRVHRR